MSTPCQSRLLKRSSKPSRIRTSRIETLETRRLLIAGAYFTPEVEQNNIGTNPANWTSTSGVVRIIAEDDSITDPNSPEFYGSGSGILLDDRMHVLTAAHVAERLTDSVVDRWFVQFNALPGDPFRFNEDFDLIQVSGQEIVVHPDYAAGHVVETEDGSGFFFGAPDLAIIRLAEIAPPHVPTFRLPDAPIDVGTQITVAGYGESGRSTDPFLASVGDTLHRGTNRVSERLTQDILDSPFFRQPTGDTAHRLRIDLDGSFASTDTLNDGVSSLDAISTQGDSGGPLFVDDVAHGVFSIVNAPIRLGSVAWYEELYPRLDWIRSVINVDPGSPRDLTYDMAITPWGNDGRADEVRIQPDGDGFAMTIDDVPAFTTEFDAGGATLGLHEIGEIKFTGTQGETTLSIEMTPEDSTYNAFFRHAFATDAIDLESTSLKFVGLGNQNHINRFDANGDGRVSAIDALIVINQLNRADNGQVPASALKPEADNFFYDVNGNGFISAIDALQIINALNRMDSGSGASGEAPPSNILGVVESVSMTGLDVDGEMSFEFTAARDGILTVELGRDQAVRWTQLKLYDADRISSPLATTSFRDAHPRMDVEVEAGKNYFVQLDAVVSNVDFHLTNLVQQTGSTLTVSGTAGNDQLNLETTTSDVSLTVNGTEYQYGRGEVSTIRFDAGAGYDSVTTSNTSDRESLYIRPDRYDIYGPGYRYSGTDIEQQTIQGNTSSYAYVYGSTGNDRLSARVGDTTMVGPGYQNRIQGLSRVYAYGHQGGNDSAQLYDTAGNDTFISRENASYIYGNGMMSYAYGFQMVYAYGSQGYDRAYLYDGAGNDTLYANRHYAYIYGNNKIRMQMGFDFVSAISSSGVDRKRVFNVDFVLNTNDNWLF